MVVARQLDEPRVRDLVRDPTRRTNRRNPVTVRLSTNVGAWTSGRIARASISASMRVLATTPAGVTELRS
jgi:hypothetical protein